jgi:hypothetical protein
VIAADILSAGSAPAAMPVRFRVGLTIGGVVQAASLADVQSLLASIVEAVGQAPELTAVEVQTTVQQLPST